MWGRVVITYRSNMVIELSGLPALVHRAFTEARALEASALRLRDLLAPLGATVTLDCWVRPGPQRVLVTAQPLP
jgi:hypothetical protein